MTRSFRGAATAGTARHEGGDPAVRIKSSLERWTTAMSESGVTLGSLLIDRFLPRYDVSVVRASVLPARPEDCYRAARQLDVFRDAILRTLLGLRALPNRLADLRRLGGQQRTAPTVAEPSRTFSSATWS